MDAVFTDKKIKLTLYREGTSQSFSTINPDSTNTGLVDFAIAVETILPSPLTGVGKTITEIIS